jgi:hypothetical protein
MGLTKQQLTTMTNYRIELQAFVDAAASFTEPALGHHKAWAEAVARARVALSEPEPQRRCIYSPVQIAECGGPCQQGPEHCDCGELW